MGNIRLQKYAYHLYTTSYFEEDTQMARKTGFVCDESYFWHDTGNGALFLLPGGYVQSDGDAGELAIVGKGSYEIALLSTGGTLTAVEHVMAGKIDNAYALTRPPGHHAEKALG